MPAVQIIVFGKVQGVFFRKKTQEKAIALQINGFVRNSNDGSVYIEAEGDAATLEAFIDWCRMGPSKAVVERLEKKSIDPPATKGFEIRRTV